MFRQSVGWAILGISAGESPSSPAWRWQTLRKQRNARFISNQTHNMDTYPPHQHVISTRNSIRHNQVIDGYS